MLKFFRKIRQKLINEGNLKRYLLYAIGEILLVMIGILLALQVNNWNIGKVNKKKEIAVLEGILDDLQMDTLDQNANIRVYDQWIKLDSVLISNLVENTKYSDSLAIKIGSLISFTANSDLFIATQKAYFDEAKQIGIKIISNEELRTSINRLYEFDYEYLRKSENEWNFSNHYKLLNQDLNQYLELKQLSIDGEKRFIPSISKEKYQKLLNDKYIHHKIHTAMGMKKSLMREYYVPTQSKLLELINEISEELENLK